MKKSVAGFTLIELIIVIIIIGILAAIAIPRFINQTTNARVAAMGGLAGAVNSAIALAQAEYRAEGNSSSSTTTSISMDGTTVNVTAGAGNPQATAAGIGTALRTTQGFTIAYAGTSPSATATFTMPGAPSTCSVVYSDATGNITNNATSGNC